MTLDDLRTLLDYHYWARDRMLDALEVLTPEQYTRDLGSSFRSIHETAVHIYAAEWAWHQRWIGQSPTGLLQAADYPDVPALRRVWTALEGDVRGTVERLGESGLAREFDYTLLSGHTGRSVFWHMVQHVVNHASYHRGQVTTILRQAGGAPGKPTDLIAFYRLGGRP